MCRKLKTLHNQVMQLSNTLLVFHTHYFILRSSNSPTAVKKLPVFFLLIFAISLNAQVVVKNPTFETLDTAFASGFFGWRSNKFYPIFPDSTQKHGGKMSLRMESVPGGNFGAFMQLVPVPKSDSYRKITISGFLKRENVTVMAGFWINVLAGKESIAFDNMNRQLLKGSHDWEEVRTTVIADERATDLNLGGLLSGQGIVWFDDFTVHIEALEDKALPDTLASYLNEAFDIMEKHALNRDSVDWPKSRARAAKMASTAKSYADCYPAIMAGISSLGDGHSFLLPADASKKWENAGDSNEDMPLCTGKILEDNIAYISMPGVSSGDGKANTYFADQLHKLLEELDSQNPGAWVFDLRENTGGNCWPMLAGIGPLLGEGTCGYFLAPGQKPSNWFYKKGVSGIGKGKITRVSRKPYTLKQKLPKVAVLTGPKTGSSGEVVTVAFRGRPNCRSFGAPTYGVSTGNANYSLRDGAKIFLCSSVYADRNKVAYGGKIIPDVLVEPGENDPVLKAATNWLLERI
jgi:carboxyl-terminal processing protease